MRLDMAGGAGETPSDAQRSGWRAFALAAGLAVAGLMAGCVGSDSGGDGGNILAGVDLSPRGSAAAPARGRTGDPTQVIYFDDTGTEQVVQPGVRPTGEGYTVNLQGVSVDVAAKSLLTDILGATYTIAPGIDAKVTLATGGPVQANKLIQLFEEALKADGLILTKQGAGYVISQAGDGITSSMAAQGYGLTALPLRHVGAKRMLALLDGFAVPQGTIRAADSDDMLLVRGNSADRAAVSELVNSLDSGLMAKPNAGIAFLKNASAAAVASDLGALGDSEPAAAGWKMQVLDRSNALLVMARSAGDLTAAMKWIRRLDQTGSTDAGDVQVYQVQYAKASDLAKLLNATLGGGSGAAPAQSGAGLTEMQATAAMNGTADATGAATGGATGGGAALDLMNPTPSGAAVSTMATDMGGGGAVRFTPNDADNTLIIRAPQPVRRQALALLTSLDRPPVQVLIDVMLVEVSLNDATKMGVQAYLESSAGNASLTTGSSGTLGGNYPGFNLTLGSGVNPKAIISDLSQVTKVKVVSAPSVVAFENEQAEIKVVEQVPIITQEVQQTTSKDAPTVNTVEYRDAGVILRVTPQVSQNNMVNLQVEQELSAVVRDTASSGTTLTPTLRQRSITTRVAAYDRQTIVLGGLISSESTKGRNKILGLIPNFANDSRGRTELVVFITPHVLRNQQDTAAAGAELRAKMQLMSGQ